MGLTSGWIILQKYGHTLGWLGVGLLLFITGWYSGRAMSPYYASHPIIFEDRTPEECAVSAGGSQKALVALQHAGQPPPATPSGKPEPTVAAIQDKVWVASIHSTLFHHRNCATVARIKEENKIWFTTPDEATAAGYAPSVCARGWIGEKGQDN